MSQYSRTYNSFSGIDISPIFNGKTIGEVQGLSWSCSREKAPLYTMGSANPRSFSRGKRGIAGAMVFLTFDREALLDTMQEQALFWGNKWEKNATGTAGSRAANALNEDGVTVDDKVVMRADYMDQIPNFDVKLMAVTERGHGAMMEIHGVEILNAGSGVSIDDITTDVSTTWIGTRIVPWHAQTYVSADETAEGASYTFTKNEESR